MTTAVPKRDDRLLEVLIEQLPSGLLMTDVDGTILCANATFFALLGSDLSGATTLNELERKSHATSPAGGQQEILRVLASGQDVNEDFKLQPATGALIVRMRRREVTDDDGNVLYRLVLIDDVTELRSRDAYQKQIMALASHDLRNPLSAIAINAGILSRPTPLEDARRIKAASGITSASGRMGRMIDDLFDYTLAALGKGMPLRVARADLGIIANAAAVESRSANPGRDIHLETQGDLHGTWDSQRLHQALKNLLSAAMKCGDPATPVAIDCREDLNGTGVTCSVVSQGVPIPATLLPHIFDAYQHDPDAGRHGLGLGLNIVRRILDSHQGTVSASSADGTTRLTFNLPKTPTEPMLGLRRDS